MKKMSLQGPCLPLSFLLELHPRETNRKGWPEGTKDSAIFFRHWELFNTLREPEVIAILNPRQRAAATKFQDIMGSLPWQTWPTHPHISELPDDDLSPLMEAGRELYAALSEKEVVG